MQLTKLNGSTELAVRNLSDVFNIMHCICHVAKQYWNGLGAIEAFKNLDKSSSKSSDTMYWNNLQYTQIYTTIHNDMRCFRVPVGVTSTFSERFFQAVRQRLWETKSHQALHVLCQFTHSQLHVQIARCNVPTLCLERLSSFHVIGLVLQFRVSNLCKCHGQDMAGCNASILMSRFGRPLSARLLGLG